MFADWSFFVGLNGGLTRGFGQGLYGVLSFRKEDPAPPISVFLLAENNDPLTTEENNNYIVN
jgi:hypothetical protein